MIQAVYSRFIERMQRRVDKEALEELNEHKKQSKPKMKTKLQVEAVRLKNDKIYDNKRQSYTRNQIICGGIPIYVDENVRDKVIPVGTQKVETFYDVLE